MEYPIKKDTIKNESRTNRIYLLSMECQFEVFVNDVLLFKLMGDLTNNGAGVSGGHDINQLMLTSGIHEVKIRMYPKYGQLSFGVEGYVGLTPSYFKDRDLRTMVHDEKMGGHFGLDIGQMDWDKNGDHREPDKFEGLPIYEWLRTYDAQVPFSFEGWRNSVNLKKEQDDDKKDIRAELLQAYKKIYQIIKDKDTAAYLSMIKESEDLITSTLFYKADEKIERQSEFVKLFQSGEYELEPMFEETMQLEFQGYGKLAMLLHKADGEGIIRLRNKKNPDDNVYMDFRFQRKKKGDKLTVI